MTSQDTSTAAPLVLVDIQDGIAHVRLNRPTKRNAINEDLLQALDDCFAEQLEGARVVILSGEGEHFCAGLDLFELMAKRSPDVLSLIHI